MRWDVGCRLTSRSVPGIAEEPSTAVERQQMGGARLPRARRIRGGRVGHGAHRGGCPAWAQIFHFCGAPSLDSESAKRRCRPASVGSAMHCFTVQAPQDPMRNTRRQALSSGWGRHGAEANRHISLEGLAAGKCRRVPTDHLRVRHARSSVSTRKSLLSREATVLMHAPGWTESGIDTPVVSKHSGV